MALIVQKYGGTSVGSAERIKNVAKRIAKAREAGHDVVVVVSAMSGETNRLVALAHEMQDFPDPREMDVVFSTGEQVTIGLLAMALKKHRRAGQELHRLASGGENRHRPHQSTHRRTSTTPICAPICRPAPW
jgi:aspartokinase